MRQIITKSDGAAPEPQGRLSADEDDSRFYELTNLVKTASITLDAPTVLSDTDLNMMAQAMTRYASGAIYCVDTGTPNAYLLAATGLFQGPKAYFTGLMVAFWPGGTATGRSTINAFGLGFKTVYRHDGGVITPGDITSGKLTFAIFDASLDGGTGAFKLAPWCVPQSVTVPAAVPQSGEGVSVDAYQAALNFNGLTIATPVDSDRFAFYSQQGLHHRTVTLAQLKALIVAALGTGGGGCSLPVISPVMKIQERRPNLVKRGIAGGVWVARPLSDVIVNQISGASFDASTHRFTLPKGSYRIDFVGVVADSGNARARIFNVTANAQVAMSFCSDGVSSGGASNGTSPPNAGIGWFSISGTSVFELQAYAFHGGWLGDHEVNNIGTGNYYVDGWVSIEKEG